MAHSAYNYNAKIVINTGISETNMSAGSDGVVKNVVIYFSIYTDDTFKEGNIKLVNILLLA